MNGFFRVSFMLSFFSFSHVHWRCINHINIVRSMKGGGDGLIMKSSGVGSVGSLCRAEYRN